MKDECTVAKTKTSAIQALAIGDSSISTSIKTVLNSIEIVAAPRSSQCTLASFNFYDHNLWLLCLYEKETASGALFKHKQNLFSGTWSTVI